MNRLEIFQKVYGADHVFTTQELERLQQVAELIVRECADHLEVEYGQSALTGNAAAKSVKQHFGVEE